MAEHRDSTAQPGDGNSTAREHRLITSGPVRADGTTVSRYTWRTPRRRVPLVARRTTCAGRAA